MFVEEHSEITCCASLKSHVLRPKKETDSDLELSYYAIDEGAVLQKIYFLPDHC